MGAIAVLIAVAASITSIVCWILTLIKMFPAGVGHFVVGLLCALYAFIWGWQNRDQMGVVMPIWTVAFLIGIVGRVILVAGR